jgi:hypothetical protein
MNSLYKVSPPWEASQTPLGFECTLFYTASKFPSDSRLSERLSYLGMANQQSKSKQLGH